MKGRARRFVTQLLLVATFSVSVVRTTAAESQKWSYIAWGAGHAADAVTTTVAIRSGRAREANPLLPSDPGGIILMKSLFAVPQLIGLRYLATHGHPKLARFLGYGIGAGSGAVAWRNTRVAR